MHKHTHIHIWHERKECLIRISHANCFYVTRVCFVMSITTQRIKKNELVPLFFMNIIFSLSWVAIAGWCLVVIVIVPVQRILYNNQNKCTVHIQCVYFNRHCYCICLPFVLGLMSRKHKKSKSKRILSWSSPFEVYMFSRHSFFDMFLSFPLSQCKLHW